MEILEASLNPTGKISEELQEKSLEELLEESLKEPLWESCGKWETCGGIFETPEGIFESS